MKRPQRVAIFFPGLIAFGITTTFAATSSSIQSCLLDEKIQAAASLEIQAIVAADQADRVDYKKMDAATDQRDRMRRMRIGELFGAGCFRTAADFMAAALVFQHGEVPEHFFQAYIWSKRAMELGDESRSNLMALAIDRYLLNTGRKQLFGSQADRPGNSPCACMQTDRKSVV